MLQGTQEYWDFFEPLVKGSGFDLFDVEIPSTRSKIVRLYIWRGRGTQGGVMLDDCAAVSKRITNDPEFEQVFPDNVALEVSSPGVNRKLRRVEHFRDAVGERVRVSCELSAEEGGKTTLTGMLKEFDGTQLVIDEESQKQTRTVPFASVSRAQIDFLFG